LYMSSSKQGLEKSLIKHAASERSSMDRIKW
jgi:hypothetical protein